MKGIGLDAALQNLPQNMPMTLLLILVAVTHERDHRHASS